MGSDQPGEPSHHEKDEQRCREADAHRQRADEPVGRLATREVIERRTEARDDRDEHADDDDADRWVHGARIVTQVGERKVATWPLALLAAAAIVAFVALGLWQWERGVERESQWERFAAAGAALPAGARDLAALPRFERVALTGRYDPAHQFVLDNRSRDGRPGYEVLTPFVLVDGRAVLVNRGWLPFSGYRDRLPHIAFEPAAPLTIAGRLDNLPAAGLESGRAGPRPGGEWPKLASFPTLPELAAALGRGLEPRIVLLDGREPHGYARAWRPPGVEPSRHYSYAVQWWSFAALSALLWIVLSLRRGRV